MYDSPLVLYNTIDPKPRRRPDGPGADTMAGTSAGNEKQEEHK